jgi:hypothetical protein
MQAQSEVGRAAAPTTAPVLNRHNSSYRSPRSESRGLCPLWALRPYRSVGTAPDGQLIAVKSPNEAGGE